jgi:hypothetical protein
LGTRWGWTAAVTDLNKTQNLFVRKELRLYNILVKFRVHLKLVRPIKICLNGTGGKVRAGKHLPHAPTVYNSLKQGDDLSSLLYTFA